VRLRHCPCRGADAVGGRRGRRDVLMLLRWQSRRRRNEHLYWRRPPRLVVDAVALPVPPAPQSTSVLEDEPKQALLLLEQVEQPAAAAEPLLPPHYRLPLRALRPACLRVHPRVPPPQEPRHKPGVVSPLPPQAAAPAPWLRRGHPSPSPNAGPAPDADLWWLCSHSECRCRCRRACRSEPSSRCCWWRLRSLYTCYFWCRGRAEPASSDCCTAEGCSDRLDNALRLALNARRLSGNL